VVALTNHPTTEILRITLDSGDAETDNHEQQLNNDSETDDDPAEADQSVMETTPDHPIYVEGQGWLNAENLSLGDRLRRADGGTAKVLAIERVVLAEPVAVYNFTVKGPHTYFVLEVGVLVHNESGCKYNPDAERWWATSAIEINGKLYNRGQFIPTTEAHQLEARWILENLQNGNVDDVLRRFDIDPEADWVKEVGLKDDLLDLGKGIKEKDVAPTIAEQETIREFLSPDIPLIAVRTIPERSGILQGLLKHKPEGAKVLALGKGADKIELKGPPGIRVILDNKRKLGNKGDIHLVVSDLDAAVVIKADRSIMNNEEFIRTFIRPEEGPSFNQIMSEKIERLNTIRVDHGHQVYGQAFIPGVPSYASAEYVYVFRYSVAGYTFEYLPDVVRENALPTDPIAIEFFRKIAD
jgi:hypothetical protein